MAALYEGVGALRYVAANKASQGASESTGQAADDGRATTVIIKDNLQHALQEYDEGEADEASEIVHDTYMQPFEDIEGDLIEHDPDLVTQLETDFNATLPTLIKDKALQRRMAQKSPKSCGAFVL